MRKVRKEGIAISVDVNSVEFADKMHSYYKQRGSVPCALCVGATDIETEREFRWKTNLLMYTRPSLTEQHPNV